MCWISHFYMYYVTLRQPKYGHLKDDLHNVLRPMEKILVHGQYNGTSYGKNVSVRRLPN